MIYHKHIDGLRCLAVMAVFLMHLGVAGFGGGFVGVDVFFVISGFLITGLITEAMQSSGGFSFLRFYSRRAVRILPALFVTLLLCFVAGIVFIPEVMFAVYGRSLSAAALAVSNLFFYHQAGYFDFYSQINPLLHTWSLGVEEQFYVLWPLALFWVFKGCRAKQWLRWLLFFVTVFVASVLANLIVQQHDVTQLYYGMPYRAFEFCIGAVLVCVMQSGKRPHNAVLECLCVLGLGMIAYCVYVYSQLTVFPSVNALLPTVGAALLVYAGSSRYIGSVLRWRPIRHVGLISYSLYLIHWPLIRFVSIARAEMHDGHMTSIDKVLIVLVAVLLAQMMYRWVEQPFRRRAPATPAKQRTVLMVSCLFALGIAGLGYSMQQPHWWRWRLLPAVSGGHTRQYRGNHWGGSGFHEGYLYHGKTPYPQLVMLGDSYGTMLDSGLYEFIARPLDLTTYAASSGFLTVGNKKKAHYHSCLSLPGLTCTPELRAPQSAMDASNKEQLDDALMQLTRSQHSVLLLAFCYSYQLSRALLLGTHHPLGIDLVHMTRFSDYQLLLDHMEALRSLLGGRELVLIGELPGSSYQANDCVAPMIWFRAFDQHCVGEDPIGRNQGALQINRVLSRYAKQHAHVHFINPYEFFCPGGRFCATVDKKGMPYYVDTNHLSVAGSRYFIAHIKGKLTALLAS